MFLAQRILMEWGNSRSVPIPSKGRRFKEGQHLYGATILDNEGKMIGSMMVVEYPIREELDNWLKVEPYVVGNLWQKIEVQSCRVASTFMKLYD